MDARERLRRYLEQRKELGETELVLDRLAVDDVMAMLGAREAPKTRGARSSATQEAPQGTPVPPMRATPDVPAALDARLDSRHDSSRETSGGEGAAAPPRHVPEPTSRLDPAASGDWRHALRQADVSAKAGDTRSDTSPTPPRTADAATTHAASLPPWLAALNMPAGLATTLGATTSSAHEPIDGLSASLDLDGIANLVRACTRCALHASARQAVPGEGNPHAELLCVGEAPGANEDEQGRPFVGEAGQLLTKILGAIDLPRESVYICNVLKHRPPGNRDPLPEEVAACQPFLRQQLLTVRPRVIVALGRFAAQTLLGTTMPLGKLREQIHLYHGIPVIVTYHPAALLRNDAWKRPTWSDVKLARRILDASRAASVGDPAS